MRKWSKNPMTNTAVPHETTTITILLLTGPSGSGKTTVTQSLSQTIETHHDNVSTSILHQDDYFTQPFRPYEQRVDASYEDDSGIDYEKLRADILLQITSAARRQREATTTREYVLLVEGHLANAQKLRLHSIPTATLEDTTRHHCTTCVHVQSIALVVLWSHVLNVDCIEHPIDPWQNIKHWNDTWSSMFGLPIWWLVCF